MSLQKNGSTGAVIQYVKIADLSLAHTAALHESEGAIITDQTPRVFVMSDGTTWRTPDTSIVSTDPAFPTSITIEPMTFILQPGDSVTLVPTLLASGCNQMIYWSSSDPTKVAISTAGVATRIGGRKGDTVKLTGRTMGGLKATCVATLEERMYIASQWNLQGTDLNDINNAGDYPQLYTYTQHRIGGGARKSIALLFAGFWNSKDENPTTNFFADIPIKGYVAIFNDIVVPFTFGGSTSYVIASGTTKVESDSIQASAFNVTEFADNDVVVVKGLIDFDGAGNLSYADRWVASNPGDQIIFSNPADTVMSDYTAAGAFTYTGTTPDIEPQGAYQPWLIGATVSGGEPNADMIQGDSIISGQSDEGVAPSGYGWFQRGLVGADHPPAVLNFAIPGSTAEGLLGNTYVMAFQEYCTKGLVALGANDWQEETAAVADVITSVTSWKTQMAAAGFSVIAAAELGCWCDSTDSFVTETNQTVHATFDTGGSAELFNAALRDVGFDFIFQTNAIRGDDWYKWKTDGATENLYTIDGMHLHTVGATMQAEASQADILAVFVTGGATSALVDPPAATTTTTTAS